MSPSTSSSVLISIEYATKQRMAPTHRSMEKPPKRFLQNLTHSGVVFGGVRALGPSRSKMAFACAVVKPYNFHRIAVCFVQTKEREKKHN